MKYERADPIRLLRRFGLGARGQEGVAAHVGGLVDEEGGPRAPAFQPGERARGAGVEDGDPHVGGNLVEPIPQRPVRVAIVADQQPLLVGVAGVIEEDFGPPGAAGGAPRVHDVLVQQVERVEQIRAAAAASARSRWPD